MPAPLSLVSVAPNPFYPDGGGYRDTTTIVFSLGLRSKVWIHLYSFRQRLARTLASSVNMAARTHSVVWDGKNDKGKRLPIGSYTVRIVALSSAGYHIATEQVILFSRLSEHPGNPIYAPAGQQAASPSVLFDQNRFGIAGGAPYLMWYDSPEPPGLAPKINLASSYDGINWTDLGPVNGLRSPAHCIALYRPAWAGKKFKIWYRDSTINNSISAIRYAESNNGLSWSNDQAVSQDSIYRLVSGEAGTWNSYTFGPCFVIYTPGAPNAGSYPTDHAYAMYYLASPDAEKLVTALAFSSDGRHWRAAQNTPVLTGTDFGGEELIDTQYTWDEYSVLLRSMARTKEGLWFAYYSAGDDYSGAHKGIGFAISANGLRWFKGSFSDPLLHINDGPLWRYTKTCLPFIVVDKGKFSGFGEAVYAKVWFCGSDEPDDHGAGNYGIGYATLTVETK